MITSGPIFLGRPVIAMNTVAVALGAAATPVRLGLPFPGFARVAVKIATRHERCSPNDVLA